ncbi:MAG TPA: conjugal transfer protein TraD [Candidatus Competibacter sp.]|mgnify:CR=1 FL=1|nr:conjugal transfer protein TraD [Candidatus Competibacter sp.]
MLEDGLEDRELLEGASHGASVKAGGAPSVDVAEPWLLARVEVLRRLKKPTAHQAALVALLDAPRRTPTEEKALALLVRNEKSAERMQKLAARLRKDQSEAGRWLESTHKEARKARNHRLIVQGLLFDWVSLEALDRAEMAGLLVEAAEGMTPEHRARWKAKGRRLLEQKERASVRPPEGEP